MYTPTPLKTSQKVAIYTAKFARNSLEMGYKYLDYYSYLVRSEHIKMRSELPRSY